MDPISTTIIGGVNALGNLFQSLRGAPPDPNSARTAAALQTGMTAAERYGVFAGPTQQSIAEQTASTFQATSPAGLAALNDTSAEVGFTNGAFAFLQPPASSSNPAPIPNLAGMVTAGILLIILVMVLRKS